MITHVEDKLLPLHQKESEKYFIIFIYNYYFNLKL